MVNAADIFAARERLKQYLHPTPFEYMPQIGPNVWLKLENANLTHSFKIRGALNAMLLLDEAARARGIVTASSGNHAQGVAYAARLLNLPAKILMPMHTPKRKVNNVRRFGAEAVLFGTNYDETELEGRRLERDEGLTFVSPYNDAHVIAGAGTIGLEIVDELPDVERVIVPASGCGLISGVGLAIKNHSPAIEVVGVNAFHAPALYNWLNGIQLPQIWETLAEALSGEIEVGSITFELSKQVVDRCELVTEEQIANAMHWMMVNAGWIVEGGGSVGVAALLSGVIPLDDRKTVVVISGGNVDEATLRRVLN
ncbi:MAG: pyridoxal-phosphate dependent enzyme [Anaerolineaceae bacterium]|nr:pyridoxal-phosphate dependent enzyme [Anaerolineaceae bacterium]